MDTLGGHRLVDMVDIESPGDPGFINVGRTPSDRRNRVLAGGVSVVDWKQKQDVSHLLPNTCRRPREFLQTRSALQSSCRFCSCRIAATLREA